MHLFPGFFRQVTDNGKQKHAPRHLLLRYSYNRGFKRLCVPVGHGRCIIAEAGVHPVLVDGDEQVLCVGTDLTANKGWSPWWLEPQIHPLGRPIALVLPRWWSPQY